MQYFNYFYSSALFFLSCMSFNSYGSTALVDSPNFEDSRHKAITTLKFDVNAPFKPIFHSKVLEFREQELEQADITLIQQGRYEEVGLASTNIKLFGLTSLMHSQETLLNLDIENNSLTSNVVSVLGLFKHLQFLNAAQNYFKDADMEIIGKSLTQLQVLNIQYNFVTSKGIVPLQALTQLESLDCGFLKLDNEGIYNISQINSLKRLYVRGGNFDANALEYFLAMPNLEVIDISYNKISSEELSKFTSRIKAEVIADHLKQPEQ